MIAALYAVLTYVAAAMNLAYGPVQFRFSEALTILPVFTPAAVPGLAIGCLLSNLASPLGMVDWVFGTFATLAAAVLSRMLRQVTWRKLSLLSVLPPVLCNALVIGAEVACLSESGSFALSNITLPAFLSGALSVGAGELVVCVVLGIPLMALLHKIKFQERILKSCS